MLSFSVDMCDCLTVDIIQYKLVETVCTFIFYYCSTFTPTALCDFRLIIAPFSRLSNGWIIKIGRDLDYFQRPEVRMSSFC